MRLLRDFLLLLPVIGIFFIVGAAGASKKTSFDPVAKIYARTQAMRMLSALQADAAFSYSRYAAIARKIERLANKGEKDGYNPIKIVSEVLNFDAHESVGTIDTVTTVTIEALEDGVTQATFFIIPLSQFRIEDNVGNELDYEYDGYYQIVTVTLPTSLDESEQQILKFFNAGEPNCEPDPFFQMVFCCVSDEITFFSSLDWFPFKAAETYEDLMRTSSSVDINITTPLDYVAATTSDLANVESVGSELVHHFIGNFTSPYIAMAYAKFDTFEADTEDGKPVTTYIHTGTTEFGDDWASICANIINYFSDVYTPYLYNKQDVIQAIEELGGGVGPMSATFYYASALNADPSDWYSESIFSHEIGHSWWGNMVVPGDLYSPWLTEGFAEYSSRLYGYQIWPKRYQDYLYDFYFRYMQFWVAPEDEVPMSGLEIFSADFITYFTVTYLKGAQFLRMLQWLLGDETFFVAMKNYAEAYVWENTDQFPYVDDFRKVLEEESGMNLKEFFEQWVYSTGYPIYEWAAEFGKNDEGYTARVRIEQVQKSNTVYELPIEVSIWVGEEDEPRYFRVDFSGRVADETFVFDEKPRGLRVDDSFWIWGDKVAALAGDVDGSNEVDGIDLIYAAWSQGSDFADYEKYWNYLVQADFNRDGKCDGKDLAMLLDNFAKEGKIND